MVRGVDKKKINKKILYYDTLPVYENLYDTSFYDTLMKNPIFYDTRFLRYLFLPIPVFTILRRYRKKSRGIVKKKPLGSG